MTTTAIVPTVRPLLAPIPLCDTRRARGKHRRPSEVAAIVLAWSRRARGAFLLTGVTFGAAIAPAVIR